MIRINLLPVRAAKKKEMGRQQLVLFAGLVILVLGLNAIWWFNVSHARDEKVAQAAKLRAEIAQLEKIIGEVNTISKDKKALEEKLAVLDQLRKARTGPVKALDSLAQTLPQRAWFHEVTEKAGSLVIKGGAVSNEDLADLMRELKRSKYFTEPTLRKSVQSTDKESGSKYIEFELTCGVKNSA